MSEDTFSDASKDVWAWCLLANQQNSHTLKGTYALRSQSIFLFSNRHTHPGRFHTPPVLLHGNAEMCFFYSFLFAHCFCGVDWITHISKELRPVCLQSSDSHFNHLRSRASNEFFLIPSIIRVINLQIYSVLLSVSKLDAVCELDTQWNLVYQTSDMFSLALILSFR